ncbi:type-F conjugative transfer system protein TraW [Accumulibacter sp.]|uniref:type-F conjugative transfer system protein TraW n=1 Tax=Accumulibacter sp. TaxID=2053492 RepID=UPI00261901AB|nr:type-F conjugative transfer system protein TraW [Accumulibacter sp.]
MSQGLADLTLRLTRSDPLLHLTPGFALRFSVVRSMAGGYLSLMPKSLPIIPMSRRLIPYLLAFAVSAPALSAEQIGPVHPIKEPDMLQEIYRVLNEKQKSGELARLQKEAVERGKHSIENPKAVQGLSRVEKARFFYWDPTVRVPKTISDPNGNVIAEAGKTVNPLDYVNLPQNMLFFDGSDPAQVAKAKALMKHYNGQMKAILVNGQPLEMTRQWKTQVYFDQGGSLVRKLGITRVPSLVSQEGKKLRIDELEVN